jgi:hypothetical protein
VSAPDCDHPSRGAQDTVTVGGGLTRTCTLTVAANPQSAPQPKSPTRCTAVINASGPAGDSDASNNNTLLIIDVKRF